MRLLLSALWGIFSNSAWYTGLISAQIVTHTPLGSSLSPSLLSVHSLNVKKPLHFSGIIAFVRVLTVKTEPKPWLSYSPFFTPLWSLQLGEAAIFFFFFSIPSLPWQDFFSPSPHLGVPLRRRGPSRPWSTGRCRCSWRPRRTAPPVLPAPPTGPRAPGRSECTRLQQRDREGKSILSSFHCDLAVSCHLLLHCIELHSPSSVLSTSACPYGGCWADLWRVFIVYRLFFTVLFYYVFLLWVRFNTNRVCGWNFSYGTVRLWLESNASVRICTGWMAGHQRTGGFLF